MYCLGLKKGESIFARMYKKVKQGGGDNQGSFLSDWRDYGLDCSGFNTKGLTLTPPVRHRHTREAISVLLAPNGQFPRSRANAFFLWWRHPTSMDKPITINCGPVRFRGSSLLLRQVSIGLSLPVGGRSGVFVACADTFSLLRK